MDFGESSFWQNVLIAILILPYFVGIIVSAIYTNTQGKRRSIRSKDEPELASEVVQETLAGRIIATCGATLLAFLFSTVSVAAVLWTVTWTLGLPNIVLEILLVLGLVPVLWATVWTAGRAWHVERLLGTRRDVDQPIFSIGEYLSLPFFRRSVPKS
jgi:nucleoside permease NupC